MPLSERPFDRIAMDIAGSFPKNSAGYQFVLVILDYATRYPDVSLMRLVSAAKVAKDLMT